MNAQDFIYDESDDAVEFKTRKVKSKPDFASGGSNNNRKKFGRRGSSPTQFNGIHRRRKKKIRW